MKHNLYTVAVGNDGKVQEGENEFAKDPSTMDDDFDLSVNIQRKSEDIEN